MERSAFFNSVNGDRKYKAEDFARYFASFIANGVFPNPSTNLQVLENGNVMSVVVSAGKAWINGYFYENTDDLVLPIDVADGVFQRIDRVVLRWDVVSREIRAQVKKGTYASTPTPPALQRDADAYELALADVYVAAGVIGITQADITDQRLNTELCGIVHGVVEQVDTETIFNQYQSWFNNWSAQKQADFEAWLETIKDILDAETAGNLLNMIQDLAGAGRTTETVKGNADALAAHLADNANPHNVTAAQIGAISAGTTNTDINKIKALTLKIDTRNTVLTYDANGRLTKVEEKDGTTVVKTTNLTYDANGNLTQVQEIAGGTTVTTTLTYDASGKLTGTSKTVA